jgi:hypothetical protein
VGFDTARVILGAADWAIANGVIPVDFDALVESVRTSQLRSQVTVQTRRLAILYSVLGLYERAIKVDDWILRQQPLDVGAAKRKIWSLLQLRRFDEAFETARAFESQPLFESVGTEWSDAVTRIVEGPPEERVTRIMQMQLLQEGQMRLAQVGFESSPIRTLRAGTENAER